jgi:DNA-directed RNA polymerase specialized sigma24 family protein
MSNQQKPKRKKRYIKLTGKEKITPEAQLAANNFTNWYAQNFNKICGDWIKVSVLDLDILQDTFLKIHESILLKNLKIKDYKFYLLRSYYTNRLAVLKQAPNIDIIKVKNYLIFDNENETEINNELEQLKKDIFKYVAENYDTTSVKLFLKYAENFPKISYRELARIENISFSKVMVILGNLRKDIAVKFKGRYSNLLSL